MRTFSGLLAYLGCSGLLLATTISYPNGTTTNVSNPCANYAGSTCSTLAYFDATALVDQNDSQNISSLFVNGFDAWNANNPANAKWTLQGGPDLGGSFDVTLAAATQFDGANNVSTTDVVKGGLQIRISLDGVTQPTAPNPGDTIGIGWSQALFDNYASNPPPRTVPAQYEMDISPCATAGSRDCPPMYPYQYGDNHFFDAPATTYFAPGQAQGFFNANAYYSLADFTTRTLYVYDGVSYGYFNSVTPEPGTCFLLAAGLLLLVSGCKLRKHRPATVRAPLSRDSRRREECHLQVWCKSGRSNE